MTDIFTEELCNPRSAGYPQCLLSEVEKHGVNACSSTGVTILMQAISFKFYETIELLVEHGADVCALVIYRGSHKYMSALGVSVMNCDMRATRIMLRDEFVNSIGHEAGDTLLHLAVRNCHPWAARVKMIRLLIGHGADRELRDPEGRRPIDRVSADNDQVVAALTPLTKSAV